MPRPLKVDAEERRVHVAEALLARRPLRRIARDLGVAVATVHKDVTRIRDEWSRARLANFDALVGEELTRLEAAERAIWPHVLDGKGWAVDRLLSIQERRAKYLGLDAPEQRRDDVRIEVVYDAAARGRLRPVE